MDSHLNVERAVRGKKEIMGFSAVWEEMLWKDAEHHKRALTNAEELSVTKINHLLQNNTGKNMECSAIDAWVGTSLEVF